MGTVLKLKNYPACLFTYDNILWFLLFPLRICLHQRSRGAYGEDLIENH